MVKGTRPQTVMTVKGMMNTTMKEMITKTVVLPIGIGMPDRGRQATVIRNGELQLG